MHLYQIADYSYEESHRTELAHENLYSREEFEQLILKYAVIATKRYLEKYGHLDDEEHQIIHFSDITPHIVDLLCEKEGFNRVEYAAKYDVWGWTDLRDINGRWEDCENEETKRLVDLIHQEIGTYSSHEERDRWYQKYLKEQGEENSEEPKKRRKGRGRGRRRKSG